MHEIVSVQLGHVDPKDVKNKEVVDAFVANRAPRLNVDLTTYEIHIDEVSGCVTAKMKLSRAKKATIENDSN